MKKDKQAKKIPPPPKANVSWEDQAAYFEKYDTDDLEKAGHLLPLRTSDERLFAELKAAATKQLRKNEKQQLILSLKTEELMRLQKAAHRRHIQATTLAQAWLLERLNYEIPQAPER